jgi:hypothetical protein
MLEAPGNLWRKSASVAVLAFTSIIAAFYPNPLLQRFNLIDTPGLASVYGEDSENTRRFLQLHGEELSAITQAEASGADAVLYLFHGSIAKADEEVVQELLGPALGRATPINAIGVLTRVDAYWSDYDEPMVPAQRITRGLLDHSQVRAGCSA